MTTAVTAVGHDLVGLGQRQVELLRIMQGSAEEYRKNQEVIDRGLSVGSFAPTGQSFPTTNGNGNHAKLVQRVPIPNPSGTTKTSFVEACIRSDPGTNPTAINLLWAKRGGVGSISSALFYKTKGDMVAAAKAAAAKSDMSAAARAASKARFTATVPVSSRKKTAKSAIVDPTEIRQAVWALLRQRPMSVVEIATAIQEGELISPIPRKLNRLIMDVIKELKGADKVTRGNGLRYEILEGVAL